MAARPAVLDMVELSESVNKEDSILFIIKLEGFRNSFLRLHRIVVSKPNSPLPLSCPCPVVISSQDKLM